MRRLANRTPMFLLILTGMAGLLAYYALLTHLWFAPQARRLLAVRFITVPPQPSEALAIWLHNSKLVAGVTIAITASLLARWFGHGRGNCSPLWVADAILAVWAVGVVLTAGVLLGAYGTVQAKAFWPHGPAEACAWALLLTVYVQVRRGRRSWQHTISGLAWVEVLLALAALLEVFGGRV